MENEKWLGVTPSGALIVCAGGSAYLDGLDNKTRAGVVQEFLDKKTLPMIESVYELCKKMGWRTQDDLDAEARRTTQSKESVVEEEETSAVLEPDPKRARLE